VRALLEATLADGPYFLVEACDGAECLAACQREQPEVIVLDMVLPERSGVEVLADLRADPRSRETPVIILTAEPQRFDEASVREAGADAFLTKPFSPTHLLALIDHLAGKDLLAVGPLPP
jgi:CheY-like chemotaxis protein